ncbi:MAG: bile acid:sodium symporter family protein [Candidatus Binatia bacterium]
MSLPLSIPSMFEFYLRHEYWFAATQLGLAMLGMGATLRLQDFVAVFTAPRAFAIAAVVQVIGVPLAVVAINALVAPPPGVAFGLILVAAMPGGAMSNVATYFAKGNVALSIALTAVITLGCLVTTPAVLRLLAADLMRGDFRMPVAVIAFDIGACLLAPLTAGMMIGAARPAARAVFARWCIRASLVVVLGIAIGSAGAGRLDPSAVGPPAFYGIALLILANQLSGTVPGWLAGVGRADLAAAAIETTIRNTNLAILLKASIFPAVLGVPDPMADSVLFIALLYAGLAIPAIIPLIIVHRRLAARS